jgi:ribosomal protein S18 acetylase RimI-like enzyme
VTIRRVTPADAELIRPLWEEFEAEVPEPQGYQPATWDEAWAEHSQEVGFVAEDGEGAAAYAFATRPEHGRSHLEEIYVRPRARGRGLAKELVRALLAELEPEWLSLEVLTSNANARAVWERLGFVEIERTLIARAADLRLAETAAGASYGAIHVQTDDEAPIRRALGRFVPRLPDLQLTRGQNGWLELTDARLDTDPKLLQRLARELSAATGAVALALGVEEGAVVRYALFEAGRSVDEYLSVPDYYGPLPPGDAIALAANPTVAARLTGADPHRVRAVCRTAASPAELPPADELYRQVAEVLGIASGS